MTLTEIAHFSREFLFFEKNAIRHKGADQKLLVPACMVASRWLHQDGCIKMVASRWLHQGGCIKMVASRWLHQDGCIKVVASRWLHQDGCIKMVASRYGC